MANRYMNQFYNSLVKGKTALYGQFAVGATGAPTISAVNSQGIRTIVRGTAGKYTITLQDTYYAFLWMDAKVLLASGLPAALGVCIVSQAVNNATTPTVVIQFVDAAGAAADIDSGATVYFKIDLNSVSVQ